MDTSMDEYQYTTLMARLFSIPFPRWYMTDKEWGDSIVSELFPYFIIPKVEYSVFLNWISELNDECYNPIIKHTIDIIRKGASDHFWLLDKNKNTKVFYEDVFREGDFTCDEYYDDYILIGYNESLDIFYSNANFLNNVLNYFRGIDPENLIIDSNQIYPISSTAKAYANNLDGVLRHCSSYKGIKIIHQVMYSETLIVSRQNDTKMAVLSKNTFWDLFKMIFSSDVYMSTQYPQSDNNNKYKLIFTNSINSTIPLIFDEDRLYYGQREYYQFQTMATQLTDLLNDALSQGIVI